MTDDTALKRCSKCGAEHPATDAFFYKQEGCRDGLRPDCKDCVKQGRRKRYEADPGTYKQRSHQWRQDHPDEVIEQRRKSYWSDPERYRQDARKWAASHYEQSRQKVRDWVSRFPDRSRAHKRRWCHANPGKLRVRSSRRRAKLRSLPNTRTIRDWDECLEYWHYCCAYCGNQQGLWQSLRLTADHFIPIASDGCSGTVVANIVPACQACNSSKNSGDAIQWLTQKYGKREAGEKLKAIYNYFKHVRERE